MNHLKEYSDLSTKIKYSISTIQATNKYFANDETLTYICYINANPNMDPEELKYCINYLEFLRNENQKKLDVAIEQLDIKNKIASDTNEQGNKDGVTPSSVELTECSLE